MQVSTVLAAFQLKTMPGDSLLPVTSEKTTKVASGFMAALKVITTAAAGETPVAPLFGMAEIIVGCATVLPGLASIINGTINAEYNLVFIVFGKSDLLPCTTETPCAILSRVKHVFQVRNGGGAGCFKKEPSNDRTSYFTAICSAKNTFQGGDAV